MFETYAMRRARAETILRERGIAKPSECRHPRSVIRFKADALGRKMFRAQCIDCGRPVSSQLKHTDVAKRAGGDLERAKPWDDALEAQGYDAERHYWCELDVLTSGMLEEAQMHRREAYAEYLQTPEWRERRNLVLKRSNGVCEGCGVRNAGEVHHLTYANVGSEFLFELVAVCSTCHERIHSFAHNGNGVPESATQPE